MASMINQDCENLTIAELSGLKMPEFQ